jgi:hypothetical protein
VNLLDHLVDRGGNTQRELGSPGRSMPPVETRAA